MPGLPFLKIPLLAQLNILKDVDLNNLVNLSFCSERTRVIVETANAELEKLDIQYCGTTSFRFNWNDDYYIKCSLEEPVRKIVKTYNNWKQNQEVLFESNRTMDSLRELLTDHLMKTFKNVECVNVTYSDIAVLDIPVWKYTRSLNKFWCSTTTEREILKKEEIEFILNELTINDTLVIYPPVADVFRYSEGFAPKTVDIRHANWVQFEAILNSKSSCISLKQIGRPSAAQLNNFLKLWMSKEKMEDLELLGLELQTGHKFSKKLHLEVLDGIVHQIDPISGDVRIQRVDGKSASVNLDQFRLRFSVDQFRSRGRNLL